jgi:hypothetical protein
VGGARSFSSTTLFKRRIEVPLFILKKGIPTILVPLVLPKSLDDVSFLIWLIFLLRRALPRYPYQDFSHDIGKLPDVVVQEGLTPW